MNVEEKLKKSYMRVNCIAEDCEGQTIAFVHAKQEIRCSEEGCDELLVAPMGGKAEVLGEFAGYISD